MNQSIKTIAIYILDSKFTNVLCIAIADIVTYLVIFVGTTNSSSTDLEIATLCFSL